MKRAAKIFFATVLPTIALLVCWRYASLAADVGVFPAEPEFLKDRNDAVWMSVRNGAVLNAPAGKRIKTAGLGEGFAVTSRDKGYVEVALKDGAKGYIASSQTSSRWILIEKKKKRLSFVEGRKVLDYWGADFGADPDGGDKVKQGDGKTPEGEYYVASKIPNSQFYKAFLISYPKIDHAERALKEGRITTAQRNAIVNAIRSKGVPPQGTPLGGYIEIHGNGTGGFYNWTLGCIGMQNVAIDFMWDKVVVGTPIVIVP